MRIIDADALSERVCFVINNSKELVTSSVVRKAVLSLIDTQPAIEAEPVVRCKDCKWQWTDECPALIDDDTYSFVPTPDFYCAIGERKDEHETN